MPKKNQHSNKTEELKVTYNTVKQSNNFIAQLSPTLFWDTDINQLDPEKHAAYIVARLMTRGTIDQFKLLLNYYGKSKVAEVVRNIRDLDERTLNFCSIYFDIPITEFRCYKLKQSNPSHWNY